MLLFVSTPVFALELLPYDDINNKTLYDKTNTYEYKTTFTNWKIELFDDHFIFTNFIGKKIYQYVEIRLMDVNIGYRVCFGKRRIIDVPYMCDNWNKIGVYYRKHGKIEEWKKTKSLNYIK